MYGNRRRPGIFEGSPYRHDGSIWMGYPEATWFRVETVKGAGAEAKPLPLGTIVKEDVAGKAYLPIADGDIAVAAAGVPGPRLGIVADENVKADENGIDVLIGTAGQVDQTRLLVGEKKYDDLTDEQKGYLRQQLEAWGFGLVAVQQS